MGYTLFYCKVHVLIDVIMACNPNKKMRLDFQDKNGGSEANEELWGQDDLTAEQFDMLEIQATQSCNQNVAHQCKAPNKTSVIQNNSIEVDDLKLQYELEGRIKLLSHSLEKSTKELNEERLNRERLIKERMKEFTEREVSLRKEVDRMQSILEFKDQEMKSTYSKLHVMKSHLQARKCSDDETEINLNFEDFIKCSKSALSVRASKQSFPTKFHRKYKLITDTPEGKTNGVDVLSALLFTRFALPSFPTYESSISNGNLEKYSSNFGTSAFVMKLKNEQSYYELLEYYNSILKNHITILNAVAFKSHATSCSRSSPMSFRKRDSGSCYSVISCLLDIAYIFSCLKSEPVIKENCNLDDDENVGIQKAVVQSSSSHFLSSQGNLTVNTLSEILESLLALANPQTYPNGYSKIEEIEYSLSVLLTICATIPEKFLKSLNEIPIYAIIKPPQSVTAMCTTIRMLIALSCCKNFITFLVHRNDNCIPCIVADYLINVVSHYPETHAVSMTLIEDFLSLLFSTQNFLEVLLETSECISQVIQGIIISLWKYCQVREEVSLSTEIIKKGFLLLHFSSCAIPNFKERRNPVENEYIYLISTILSLTKEIIELRELYDLIHSLWDFQTDVSEFDIEDLSEETQNSVDDMDIVS